MSRFLSCAGGKFIHLFATIKKSTEFAWIEECKKVFGELKKFLSAPSVLVRLKLNSPLILYLEVSEKAISSVLVQDSEGDKRSAYFVIKVFKRAKIHYQKIERLALVVMVTAGKLRQYFQGHPIIGSFRSRTCKAEW